ncbi:MAG: CbiX/SirB N-terminal domain-containing protein [Faecalibacterium sp.]
MKGILILAHGSRQKSTEDTLVQIVAALKERVSGYEIEFAFMEFSEKDIPTGIDALVAKGISDIVAVPYFLFDGIHIRQDIPEEIEKALQVHPNVTVTLGKTLGADPRLADVLADRVQEALA